VTDAAPPDGRGPLGTSPAGPPEPEELGRAGPTLIAGSLAVLACVLLLAVLANAVRDQETFWVDTVGNGFMHGFASPAMDALMGVATFSGTNPVLLVMTAGIAILLVAARRHREALFLGVVVVGSMLLNTALKLVFQRPRPVLPWATVPPDYSFPSGHAMNSMAFALAVGVIAWRLLGPRRGGIVLAIAVAWSAVVGLSRIYLGYHYVTDVLAGFATAVVWVAVVVWAFRIAAGRRGNSRA
jgi:membrane-associated phospholipid phosphatase